MNNRPPGSPKPERESRSQQTGHFQVLAIRTAREQLLSLMGGDKSIELMAKKFAAFQSIHPLHYNPYTESKWRARVEQFDADVEPLIQKVLPELKQRFRAKDTSAQQVRVCFQTGYRDDARTFACRCCVNFCITKSLSDVLVFAKTSSKKGMPDFVIYRTCYTNN